MSKLINEIYEAGIVGAGGAGFPTHVKCKGQIKVLVINGVECEPLLQVDKCLMTHYASELMEAFVSIRQELQIETVKIGIKNKYEEIIQLLKSEAQNYDFVEVIPLPNVYPMGDEVVLIQETTGVNLRRGELPINQNIMVLNVETVFNIYKKVFTKENVTHSYVTVIGEVENPGTYLFPVGTRLNEILSEVAKVKIKEYAVVVGGPMTGTIALPNETVKKNTKGFIVLAKDHYLIRRMEDADMTHIKRIMASCSQCRACTDMCPRHLLGHEVEPHKLMNAMANGLMDNASVMKTALGCVNCGVCELYACHHDLSPRKMMVAVKQAYAKEGVRPSMNPDSKSLPDRDYRRVPSNRLLMHLNLAKYDEHVPFVKEAYVPKRVDILLSQHIGAPAQAVVEKGQMIEEGQLIAKALENALSANVHASMSGRISEVSSQRIQIERV